jgi:hypothetical protein
MSPDELFCSRQASRSRDAVASTLIGAHGTALRDGCRSGPDIHHGAPAVAAYTAGPDQFNQLKESDV